MPSTCEFHVNSPNGVYYSGQFVSGKIILTTSNEKKLKNLRIRFLGEAKVYWTENQNHINLKGGYDTSYVDFRGNEIFIDNTTIVREEGVLPPNTYTFPFTIPLPTTCPTSFESKYGHIHYALWLTIERPYRYDNVFCKPVTVIRSVDLNFNPAYKIPIHSEEVSAIGCWPFASGKVVYTLRIPFGAYASGQTMRYALNIHNQSVTDISGYKIQFIELITFRAAKPSNKTRELKSIIDAQEFTEACQRLSTRKFEGDIYLPCLPPDTDNLGIICVQHMLMLEINIGRCHSNNTITIPITIGTFPIKESLKAQVNLPNAVAATANLLMGLVPTAPGFAAFGDEKKDYDMLSCDGDLKPPEFEEAIKTHSSFFDPDANRDSQVVGFRPLYPVYRQAGQKSIPPIRENAEKT